MRRSAADASSSGHNSSPWISRTLRNSKRLSEYTIHFDCFLQPTFGAWDFFSKTKLPEVQINLHFGQFELVQNTCSPHNFEISRIDCICSGQVNASFSMFSKSTFQNCVKICTVKLTCTNLRIKRYYCLSGKHTLGCTSKPPLFIYVNIE